MSRHTGEIPAITELPDDGPPPEGPGIYRLGGTRRGQRVLIAYDDTGELEISEGPKAYGNLVTWLRERGVRVLASGSTLFTVRSAIVCLAACQLF